MGIPYVRYFSRELRWLGVVLLFCAFAEAAVLGVTLMRHRSDVVEQPGELAKDVTKLGGPCLAITQFEYAKYGPLGIGDCKVHYTNQDETAATVTLQIVRNNSWALVTADVMTDGAPLASLNWRVIRSAERSPDDPQS